VKLSDLVTAYVPLFITAENFKIGQRAARCSSKCLGGLDCPLHSLVSLVSFFFCKTRQSLMPVYPHNIGQLCPLFFFFAIYRCRSAAVCPLIYLFFCGCRGRRSSSGGGWGRRRGCISGDNGCVCNVTHTCTCTYIHTRYICLYLLHTHTHTQTHKHTLILCMHTHTPTECMFVHTHTLLQTHTHTHTHIHTHTSVVDAYCS
jgi:hypothetical protein